MTTAQLLAACFGPAHKLADDHWSYAPPSIEEAYGSWSDAPSFALTLYNLGFPGDNLLREAVAGTSLEGRVATELRWGGVLAVYGAATILSEFPLCDALRSLCTQEEFYSELYNAAAAPPRRLKYASDPCDVQVGSVDGASPGRPDSPS